MTIMITLDTNCFFDFFERAPQKMKPLFDFEECGKVNIAITTRVQVDTKDKWTGTGESPMWLKISSLPTIETIASCFRLNMSRLNMGDTLVTDNDKKILEDLSNIMSNAQLEDIDHLYGHIKAQRDIFITSDHHFINVKDELNEKFNVKVLEPNEAIQFIQDM